MKKNIFSIPLILLLAFTISSCSKINLFSPEEKLYGKWTYEKASYYKNGSLRCQEKIEDFNKNVVNFKSDGTLTVDDANNGYYYDGTWTLEEDYDYSDDGDGSSYYYLEMSLRDTSSNDTFTEYWDDMNIRKSATNFRQDVDEGHYNFKIIKQE